MSIAKKKADIIRAVKSPPQSGYNSFNKYKYSTRDDIFVVVRGELAQRNLAISTSILSVDHQLTGKKTKSGLDTMRIVVEMRISIEDGDTDEKEHHTWFAEAQTEDEKGIPQAVTQGMRFWLVNTFLLCDGSDEQLHGAAGTQVDSQPVHRKEAPPADPRQAIFERLRGLRYSDDGIARFCGYVAQAEKVTLFNDVDPGRLMIWAGRLKAMSDKDIQDRMAKIMAAA